MNSPINIAIIFAASVLAVLLSVACQGGPASSNATLEVPSGRSPNASVKGSVTYRERLALTPGATLVVELRDVSLADAPSRLIASQTIPNPGQVPIRFKVEYNRDDIDSRNRYSVTARVTESDGRLAFTNDTAYEVITRGNPSKVDMVLVLVQPPPEMEKDAGPDWRTWEEVPAQVVSANLIPNEPEHLLRVAYYQSTIEGCARPGSEGLEVNGFDIITSVTLMQPPPTAWAIPCHEQVVELDTVIPVLEPLEPGPTYRVMVNGRDTTTFTIPKPGLGHTIIAESPIQGSEVILGGAPPEFQLNVVSAMPRGSSCSQSNGYEIQRTESDRIDVLITHHQVSDPSVFCTADFPILETLVPLGSGYEPGTEYTVTINSDTATTFTAQ